MPAWPSGTSTVTAYDGLGNSAGATFTVIGGTAASSSPAPTGSSNNGGSTIMAVPVTTAAQITMATEME